MQSVIATFRNGRIELAESVNWPDGTQVKVIAMQVQNPRQRMVKASLTEWPERFFERLAEQWGDEPFERPPQGDREVREDW